MTREDIAKAICDIIDGILPEGNSAGVDPEKQLRDQLDLDSMDFLDIVMELRKRYGIEIPEEDYRHLATLNGCVNYLEPKLKGR
jgi:acyl carrier protein